MNGIVKRAYCDFVVWAPHSILVKGIKFDKQFFNEMTKNLQFFFINTILLRVLTNRDVTIDCNRHDDENCQFCYCRKGEFGQMIRCDNLRCRYTWFTLNVSIL